MWHTIPMSEAIVFDEECKHVEAFANLRSNLYTPRTKLLLVICKHFSEHPQQAQLDIPSSLNLNPKH